MVVRFQTRLHAVEVLELDEAEAAAFLWVVSLCCDADFRRWVLLEVLGYGLDVGGEGEVSWSLVSRLRCLLGWD